MFEMTIGYPIILVNLQPKHTKNYYIGKKRVCAKFGPELPLPKNGPGIVLGETIGKV